MWLGCATSSGLGTARTLDQGQVQWHISNEGGWVQATPAAGPLMRQDTGVRVGLTDDLEFGYTAGAWLFWASWVHAQADLKYRLVRAPSGSEGIDVSVGAALAWDDYRMAGIKGQALTGQVPLYIGVNTRRGHELLLMPKLAVQHTWSRGTAPETKLLPGQTIGFAWHTEPLTIAPTVGVQWARNPADVTGNMLVWQTGIGFYWP